MMGLVKSPFNSSIFPPVSYHNLFRIIRLMWSKILFTSASLLIAQRCVFSRLKCTTQKSFQWWFQFYVSRMSFTLFFLFHSTYNHENDRPFSPISAFITYGSLAPGSWALLLPLPDPQTVIAGPSIFRRSLSACSTKRFKQTWVI